jgi:hypothetical protein
MATPSPYAPKRVILHPGRTRLEDSLLPEVHKEALKKLGYVTLEQVASVAQYGASGLNKYLGDNIAKILTALPVAPLLAQISLEVKLAKYMFGAFLRAPVQAVMPRTDLPAAAYVPASRVAPPAAAGALGSVPQVNLIPGMQPVRDQSRRGTCVAHASSAAAEYYFGQLGQPLDLSRQFVYWNCKQHDGRPNQSGTFLGVAMPLLVTDGACVENTWPYNPNPVPGNEGQGPPPDAAAADAAAHQVPHVTQLTAQSVSDVKDALASNLPVPVSLVVYDYCWFPDEVRSSGDVTMPFPGDVSNQGHAVCIVGYEDLPDEPELGGGRFIIRNSWDGLWGINCQFGTGYGTIPYAYLTTYCMEAYSIA